MGKNINFRMSVVVLSVVWAAVILLPLVKDMGPSWPFKNRIKYGLDIEGGLHIVMGVDNDTVLKESARNLAENLKQQSEKEGIALDNKGVDALGTGFVIALKNPADQEKFEKSLGTNHPDLQILENKVPEYHLRRSDYFIADLKKRTVEQAIETIRNRIDEFGVSEPSITAQGEDHIIIQLPKATDAARAKELVNRTAKMTFMLVSVDKVTKDLGVMVQETEKALNLNLETMKYREYVDKMNVALKAKLPPDTVLLFERSSKVQDIKLAKIPYLLEIKNSLGGELLRDAYVATDSQRNTPIVALRFNPEGAGRFAEVTKANVGRQLAIVLDDVIYSAPSINGPIPNGEATITLGNRDAQESMKEASTISMALRSGALPARLEQLEERSIGPSLGSDAISNGKKATMLGTLLVVLFMLVVYRGFGVIANIALVVNILLLLALLSVLDATLTLPGIAGIALTVGMAVDANVIINERIKDELRKGVSILTAIQEGYARAFSAILDANVTTAATGLILMYFGTGPVRGFAITLIIGIVTTMFTAVFASHALLDFLFYRLKFKSLSIHWRK